MRLPILSFLVLASSIAAADQMSPDQLAREIIQISPAGAYNPVDKTEDELLRAQIINSRMTLRHLMLAPETTEQMRICFALLIIDQQLQLVKGIPAYSSKLEELNTNQRVLAKRLQEINK